MATDMASTGVLPLPVQQVASAQRLGTFTRAYKTTSLVRTIIGSLVFLVAAMFFCAGGILPPELTVTTRVLLLASGLLSLSLALSLSYSVIQVANQRVYVFEQGLVIDKGKQVQAFPWKACTVWQSITHNYRNGGYVGTTYVYTLRRVDGYQVKFNNLTKDIAELGLAITQGMIRELVQPALHSIRVGETLTFAPFSVNQQGIGNGHGFLPWSHVQGVDVKQGRVAVKKAGPSPDSWTAKVAKIPNFFVFAVVADEMLRQASAVRQPGQI